jgi:hypothetical protein
LVSAIGLCSKDSMPSPRCLLLASGILALPRLALAQSSPGTHSELRLSWVRSAAAASCPDAGHVEADVAQRLGWSPFIRPDTASESIEASVTRDNDVWRAAIELRAADGRSLGSREVQSAAATCASLTAAAGLAIALMIEPLLPETPPVVATAPPPLKPAPLPAPSVAPMPSATGEPAEARGNLALGALAVSGILPRVALGATLTGSTRLFQRWFATVSASWLPAQRLRRDNADVGFGMTLGSIGPCYRMPIHEAWSISSCVSLLFGSLEVAVTNPAPVAPGARFWWGASTGLRLGWNTGPFEAALGVDALAHVTRHRYLIDRTEPISEDSFFLEPALALMGSLAVGAHF